MYVQTNKNRNEEDINTTEVEKPRGPKNTKKRARIYCDKKNEEEDQKILTPDTKCRRTRSQSKLVLQETQQKEMEESTKPIYESSTDMSKEDFVKSYSLRSRNTATVAELKNPCAVDENSVNRSENMESKSETAEVKSENTDLKVESDIAKSEVTNFNDDDVGEVVDTNTPVLNEDDDDAPEMLENNGDNNEDTLTAEESQKIDSTVDSKDNLDKDKSTTKIDDSEKDPNFDIEKTEKETGDSVTANETKEDESKEDERKPRKKAKKKKKKKDKKDTGSKTVKDKPKKKDTKDKSVKSSENVKAENDVDDGKPDDEEDGGDFGYYCDKCNEKYTDWKELQKHKYDCVKIAQKHVCPSCNRGFQQKCLMKQHHYFYHTKKPKKFICSEHRKVYVYKKSLDEHYRHDHSKGNYRFVCDYCGKGFFHLGEFTIHRESVHLKRKDYMCNRCQQKAFSSVGRLNAHLRRCGQGESHECNQCGKSFSSKGNLYTHISDSHRSDIMKKCQICDDKSYNSEGGF